MIKQEEGRLRWKKIDGVVGWMNYFGWEFYQNKGWRPAELMDVRDHVFLFKYEDKTGNPHYVSIAIDIDGKFSYEYKNISPSSSWVLGLG